MRCNRKIEVRVDYARLNNGELILRPHLEDTVHPFETEDDTPGNRMGAARQARAGAACYYRHAQPVGTPDNVLDLLDTLRQYDDGGLRRLRDRALIPRIMYERAAVRQDSGAVHSEAQLRYEG
ncbi:hypothetical protein GCM10027404_07550 [Arthrobacter tumbae]